MVELTDRPRTALSRRCRPSRRTASSPGGDLVTTAEATLDYGGDAYEVVFIFEFRDGRYARETAYWSKPFPAPEWRAQWVERATD